MTWVIKFLERSFMIYCMPIKSPCQTWTFKFQSSLHPSLIANITWGHHSPNSGLSLSYAMLFKLVDDKALRKKHHASLRRSRQVRHLRQSREMFKRFERRTWHLQRRHSVEGQEETWWWFDVAFELFDRFHDTSYSRRSDSSGKSAVVINVDCQWSSQDLSLQSSRGQARQVTDLVEYMLD